MEVLGWIFLILIVLSIIGTYRSKKAAEREATVNFILYKRAEKLFPEYLEDETLPSWYHESRDKEGVFMELVKKLLREDGFTIPVTLQGDRNFRIFCLCAAAAMEDSGGNPFSQASYAATKVRLKMMTNGRYSFDD